MDSDTGRSVLDLEVPMPVTSHPLAVILLRDTGLILSLKSASCLPEHLSLLWGSCTPVLGGLRVAQQALSQAAEEGASWGSWTGPARLLVLLNPEAVPIDVSLEVAFRANSSALVSQPCPCGCWGEAGAWWVRCVP